MRISFLPGRRAWIMATAALALVAVTAESAYACISTCIARYGTTEQFNGTWGVLDHCVQTETLEGPVYITCYYRLVA